jgi:hypothetical protein
METTKNKDNASDWANLSFAEKAALIKVNENIDGEAIRQAFLKAPFFKKKMENGARRIAIAGIPK